MYKKISICLVIVMILGSLSACGINNRINELEKSLEEAQNTITHLLSEETTVEPTTTPSSDINPSSTAEPTTTPSSDNNPSSADNVTIPKGYITIGFTKEEVKSIMGTPDSLSSYSWWYGLSSISFDHNGKVDGWSDISGNLKVSIGKRDENPSPITIGSTEEDVVKTMGTPDSLSSYSWWYELSYVSFDQNGKVDGWSNISGNLNVSIGKRDDNPSPFTVGSTKEDVLKAMGTPDSLSPYSWWYGLSYVSFDQNGKVDGWSNISGNLLIY